MTLRPADEQYVTVEIAWCSGCRLDCTVEIIRLPGDPSPVAVCLECGGGVELWWQPVARPGAVRSAQAS